MAKKKEFSVKEAMKIADAAVAKGDKEKALKYYNAVLSKYPENREAIDGYKNLHTNSLFRSDLDDLKELLNTGEYRELEVRAKMYIELYPDVHELYSCAGIAVKAKGAFDEALIYLKKAAELNPKNPGAQLDLGDTYREVDDFDNALKCFEKSTKIDPKFAPGYNNAGNVYMMRAEFDRAVVCFRKAAQLQPNAPVILMNAAGALKASGDYPSAIMHYHKVISINDTAAFVFLELADCETLNGNPEEAKKIYDVVISQEPNNAPALNAYANFLRETGEIDQANALLAKLEELKQQ